jgi:hypothetical protein
MTLKETDREREGGKRERELEEKGGQYGETIQILTDRKVMLN